VVGKCRPPADEAVFAGRSHEQDLETTGGGHGFEYYNRMAPRAIGYLASKLDEERRRIV